MGAISMVLDIAISPNNKLLAIADRDEKIRIHRYPKVILSSNRKNSHRLMSLKRLHWDILTMCRLYTSMVLNCFLQVFGLKKLCV